MIRFYTPTPLDNSFYEELETIVKEYQTAISRRNVMSQDFSGAKVGDKVWSIELGDATIVNIVSEVCPLICRNEDNQVASYTRGGKYLRENIYPSLFWSNPNIIAPEKPKREVEYNAPIVVKEATEHRHAPGVYKVKVSANIPLKHLDSLSKAILVYTVME